MKEFIKNKLKIEIDSYSMEQIKQLICNHKYEDLRIFFQKMKIPQGISIECEQSRTLFLFALHSKKMCKFLIETGFSPNAKTDVSVPSVLTMAIMNKSINIATLLIEHGADKNIYNNNSKNAFFEAMYNFDLSSSEKNKRFISLLLSGNKNNEINMQNQRGETILFMLFKTCQSQLGLSKMQRERIENNILFLLKRGANPFIFDNQGNSLYDLLEQSKRNIHASQYMLEEMREEDLNLLKKSEQFVNDICFYYVNKQKSELRKNLKSPQGNTMIKQRL